MTRNGPLSTPSPQFNIRRLVRDDHEQILTLFHFYLGALPDSRQAIVDEILRELASHLKQEELLFQEIARWGRQGRKLVEDVQSEHETVKTMIAEIQQYEGDDDQAMDESFEDMMQSVRTLFVAEERDLWPLVDSSLNA